MFVSSERERKKVPCYIHSPRTWNGRGSVPIILFSLMFCNGCVCVQIIIMYSDSGIFKLL